MADYQYPSEQTFGQPDVKDLKSVDPFSTDLYGNPINRPDQQRVNRNGRYATPNEVVKPPLSDTVP